MNINEILADRPVVPLVQADDPAVAVRTSDALAAGFSNGCYLERLGFRRCGNKGSDLGVWGPDGRRLRSVCDLDRQF